ncbi:hypothetical protein PROFUN_02388 [Planoprotostelium fungivorum]|uniref:Gamma-secretase-activating protein C-terminal domain-containing protein n=1 Tax=Planoprotostelium fungivorum TaxID=1890364 RepID=A0A2P6N3J5_9EUKA|nr:hypothetical protein PROFUN_13592 [Planoprotostelium fungivorum]PRP87688.1 hypothetical protein PROFUN_02388 [Planoprotostelium fungivorum]
MFKFELIHNIKEDVLARAKQLQSATASPQRSTSTTSPSTREELNTVRIVGNERDGTIICTRDTIDRNGATITAFDFYDVSTKRVLLNQHFERRHLDVIGCSVSQDRSLIAYTICVQNSTSGELSDGSSGSYLSIDEYETWWGELHPQATMQCLKRSSSPMRIQFIYSSDFNASTNNFTSKRAVYFLGFGLNEKIELQHSIELYHVTLKFRDGKLLTVPNKKVVLASSYIWCEWDTKKASLYIVSTKPGKSNASEPNIFSLKCYTFQDKKSGILHSIYSSEDYTLSYEIPLEFQYEGFDPLHILYPLTPYDKKCDLHMQMIHMRENENCLCVQHPIEGEGQKRSITVTLFILHTKTKMDIKIPIKVTSDMDVSRIRVTFEHLLDSIILFIPGIFFQIVHCGNDRGPVAGLSINREPFRVEISSSSTDSPASEDQTCVLQSMTRKTERSDKSSVPVDPMMENLSQPDVFGRQLTGFRGRMKETRRSDGDKKKKTSDSMVLYDCEEGILYRCQFNKNSIRAIYTLPNFDEDTLLLGLHLSIMHLKDKDIADKSQILKLICEGDHIGTVADLFKETLVANAFMRTLKKSKAHNHTINFDRLLPLTIMDETTYSTVRMNHSDITFTRLNGYTHIPGTKTVIREREDRKRMIIGPTPRTTAPNTPTQQPGLKRFVIDLLGLEDEAAARNAEKAAQTDRDAESIQAERIFTECLTAHLSTTYPKERQSCQQISLIYAKQRQVEANKLFESVRLYGRKGRIFELLEHLYSSLEELQFPHPDGFNAEFIRVGYRCLPRSVFMQYLDRGIFYPDVGFVDAVVKNHEDASFIYHLASKVHPQHTISNIAPAKVKEIYSRDSVGLDMEVGEDSPFIPFTVFINSIKPEYHKHIHSVVDYSFMKHVEEEAYEKLLGVSFFDTNHSYVTNPQLNLIQHEMMTIPISSPRSKRMDSPGITGSPLSKIHFGSPMMRSRNNS